MVFVLCVHQNKEKPCKEGPFTSGSAQEEPISNWKVPAKFPGRGKNEGIEFLKDFLALYCCSFVDK